jgi:DNA-binding transcriptional LysR family regulator
VTISSLMRVNLKALHGFILVSEAGSFRKAGDMLHRSQSALSMQIKQLEDQLCVSLFHRTTRRVELTAEGEQLLNYARRAISELDFGLQQIRGMADIQIGRISIGCVPSVAASVLPHVLLLFQVEYPGIKINLRELPSEELLEAIRRKDIDFGIGPFVDHMGDCDFQAIFSEPILALMRDHFCKDGVKEISLEELTELPVLMNSKSAALRGNLDRELASRGLKLKIMFEVLHVQTLVAFARAGLGVAFLPHVTIPRPLDPGMRALSIIEPKLDRTIGILSLKGQSMSPATRMLAGLITEEFRKNLSAEIIEVPAKKHAGRKRRAAKVSDV